MRLTRGIACVVLGLAACTRATPDASSVPPPPPQQQQLAPQPPPPPPRTPLEDRSCPARTLGPGPGATPRARTSMSLDPAADVHDACTQHQDCAGAPHGRCVRVAEAEVSHFGKRRTIPAHNECVNDDCESDKECRETSHNEPKNEQVCDCSPDRNVCAFANCRSDRDCPAPYTCGGYRYCHAAADQCQAQADCKTGECIYDWTARHYVCQVVQHIAPD